MALVKSSDTPARQHRGPARLLWIDRTVTGKVGNLENHRQYADTPVFLAVKQRAESCDGSSHSLDIKHDGIRIADATNDIAELWDLIGVKVWSKVKGKVPDWQLRASYKISLHVRSGGFLPCCELGFTSYRQCQKWSVALKLCVHPDSLTYFDDVSMQSSTPGCFSVPRLLPRPLVTIKHFLGYYVEPDDDPDQQQKLKRDREEVRRLSRQQGYVEILENAYEPSCTAESSEASEETTPPQATAATTIASRKSKSSLLYRVKRRLHLNSRLRGAAIQRRIGQHGEDQSESISSQDMSHENPVSRQDSGIEEDCSHEEGRLMHVSEVKKQKHDLDRGKDKFLQDDCDDFDDQPVQSSRKKDITALFANMKRIDMDEVYGNTARHGRII